MWRYNDDGVKGKIYCKQVMVDIAKTETEINYVSDQNSTAQSALKECENQKFEDQIEKLMFLYEY